MFKRIDHVALIVRDRHKSIKFYFCLHSDDFEQDYNSLVQKGVEVESPARPTGARTEEEKGGKGLYLRGRMVNQSKSEVRIWSKVLGGVSKEAPQCFFFFISGRVLITLGEILIVI